MSSFKRIKKTDFVAVGLGIYVGVKSIKFVTNRLLPR